MSNTPKKEYPNSGVLFKSRKTDEVSPKASDMSGSGEITVTKDIPAGTRIQFYIDGWRKEYINSKTQQKDILLSLRFSIRGEAKATASSKAPTAFASAKPASQPQPEAAPSAPQDENPPSFGEF